MITLYGFAYSNYFNIVKHALLLKEIPFQEHKIYPGSPELLPISPVGKVPAITTPCGTHISETTAILEYLEDNFPANPLMPSDAAERARVRQIIKVIELYIELSTRRLLPTALAGIEPNPELLTEVRATAEKGVVALNALTNCSPYLTGSTLTMADIYCRYAMAIPQLVGPKVLQWNIIEAINGLPELMHVLAESEISQKIDADMKANQAEFMAKVRGG